MSSADSRPWVDFITKAFERKRLLLSSGNTFRIVNGVYTGLPGLAVDWYDGHLVLFAYSDSYWALTEGDVLDLAKHLPLKSITLKDRTQKSGDRRESSRCLWGLAPERVQVQEGDLAFWIEIAHSHNVGLFLDTRPIRQWLRESAKGRIVNLFSYTCSLGLAAEKSGASTLNVDISKRYLEWGRDNYRLNGVDTEGSHFKVMAAERYLDWALNKNLTFDGIILDPPSFSRHEGKVFSLPKDYGRLVEKAARLIEKGGFLMAMTNYAEASPDRLRSWIEPTLNPTVWRKATWFPLGPGLDFDPPSNWRRTDEGLMVGWRIQQI